MNLKIILAGLFGTLVMTLFVTIVSISFKKPFHVVKTLSRMMQRGDNRDSTARKGITFAIAVVVHYAIGVAFAYLYNFLLLERLMRLTWPHTILFGSLAGLIGIIGWRITFAIHPNPPKLNLTRYLLVIWIGHLLFAAGVLLTYINFPQSLLSL